MGENILTILNNDSLTQEEKNILLKKLAEEYIKEENIPNKREELIEKNRKQAAENRARINQINYDSSLKEQMEVLAYLKNNNGSNQFSKSYLLSIRGSELMQIYAECMETMPEAMEKAKQERAKDKAQGIDVFKDSEVKETKADGAKEDTALEKVEENESFIETSSDESEKSENKLDLDSLANKMTEEEMNYILGIQKIALDSNVSLKEAEKMYKEGLKQEKPVEKAPEKEVPIEEENKELGQNEQVSNRVRIKSLDRTGIVLEHAPNGLFRIQVDGEDGRSLVEVPASDLEIIGKEEVMAEPDVSINPKDVDVNAKPGLKDTISIPSAEIREAIRVSEEKEEKPRRVVTKIVNKVTDAFKNTIIRGREAIDNFFGKNKEEIPSENELRESYADADLDDEEIIKNATPEDGSEEEYREAYKNMNINEKEAMSDVSNISGYSGEFDFMNKR